MHGAGRYQTGSARPGDFLSPSPVLAVAGEPRLTVTWGVFVTALINLVIVGAVLFAIVKAYDAYRPARPRRGSSGGAKRGSDPAAPDRRRHRADDRYELIQLDGFFLARLGATRGGSPGIFG